VKRCPKCLHENSDDSRFCQKCGTNLAEIESDKKKDSLEGKVLAGSFELKKKLAVGGMGAVYLAEQISLSKDVCIKVLHQHLLRDETIIKRFHREARAASRLKHPNCINVIDFGQADNGILYMAMDFIVGKDLAELLETEHPLGVDRILHIMKQIASALDEAHAHNIIHRDLKPENIMLEQRRHQRDFVTVLDFGIAKIKEPGKDDRETFQTMAGVVCGTPEYMSPEQIRGDDLDARTDLYSLGVIMWQLFTNRLPFSGATPIATVTKHLTEAPEPPSRYNTEIPAPIESLIMRLMSKKRDERPASCEEVRQRLEDLENAMKASARPAAAEYNQDLDRTMIDMTEPIMTEDQKQAAISGMSLGASGTDSAVKRQSLTPTRLKSAKVKPSKSPREVERAPTSPAPKREARKPIRDPLQGIDSVMDGGDDDFDADSVRVGSSFKRFAWVFLLMFVGAVGAIVTLFMFPSEGDTTKKDGSGTPDGTPPVAVVAPVGDVSSGPSSAGDASAAAAAAAEVLEVRPEIPEDQEVVDEVAAETEVAPDVKAAARVASTSKTLPRTKKKPRKTSGQSAKAEKSKASQYEKMGDEAFGKGNYAEAKAYFNLTLKYSSRASIHKKIGYCYKNMGKTTEAKASFRRYVSGLSSSKRAIEEEILKSQGLL
jgi:serine/threonine protein kinase